MSLLPIVAFLTAALLAVPAWSQKTAADKPDPVQLISKSSGADAATLKDFLVDQGAANITAAALAGVGASSVAVAEDTKDFAVLLSPFSKDGKGGAFVISPARVRHPMPRIDLMTQYVKSAGWRIVAGINISGAQGTTDVGGTSFRRRGFALSTNAYMYPEDDPIYIRATSGLKPRGDKGEDLEPVPGSCIDTLFKALDKEKPGDPGDVGPGTPGKSTVQSPAVAEYKACQEKVEAQARNKWFAPRWSISLGTGDVAPTGGSGLSANSGTALAGSVTYGRPWSSSNKPVQGLPGQAQIYSGWALSLAARTTRNEPVLSSLVSGPVVRQHTSLVVGRVTAGTESWRLLAEASNNGTKQTAGGDRTMKRALGLDYNVYKESWLSLRYGKRLKSQGGEQESAALLSVTLGGDLLTF